MENLENNTTDPTNHQHTDPEEIQGAGNTDQKPHTPDDDYQDLGATREETNGEEGNEESISKQELPELDKETNEDHEEDEMKPTDFDIDESTG